MKKNSKLALLLATSTLVAVVATGSIIINKKIKTNADGVIWQHYLAVNPGLETRGSKEYWINCSTFEHIFNAPTDATVIERGQPSATDIASWDATDDRVIPQYKIDDTHLWYGYYPQTRVSDESLLSVLDGSTVITSQGYYAYQGNLYAKQSATPYMSRYTFDDGTTIVNETTYWFKVEPIVWNILTSNDGNYFLYCSKLLVNTGYSAVSNNYESSELRMFMNDDFYNQAFFLDDSLIQETEVDNSASTTIDSSNPYACDNTNDKVFSLSYQDCLNTSYGFSSSDSSADTAKQCKTTDYARACGAYYNTGSSYLYNGGYWTRSPNFSSIDTVSFVSHLGRMSGNYANTDYYCIRPAMNIKIN